MASKPGSGAVGLDDGITDAGVGDAFDIGDDEADVAGGQLFEDDGLGRESAEGFDFVDFVIGAETDFHARGDASLHDADENDGAAVGVEPGIENEGLEGRIGRALGRRDALDDGFEDFLDAEAAFGADEESVVGGDGENVFDLFFDALGLGGGEIDFIDDGKNFEIVVGGEESVGHGLGFDALAGVHDEEGAFAGGEGARNFVGEVHVAGSVNEVELVFAGVAGGVVEADGFGFDGDAALALEVHGIEELGVHFALGERAGELEEAVGQGGFAVVDVRDDAEIADELGIHEMCFGAARASPMVRAAL